MHLARLYNPGLPIELQLGGLNVTAFSIAGLASYALVPAFDAAFDLGHCPLEASHLRHVFLTHGHQDHAGGAHRHLSLRTMGGQRPSRIYLPATSAPALTALLRAWEALEQQAPAALDAVVHPLRDGDVVHLSRRFRVRAFDVVHRIASLGYTVIESRKTLLPAFIGASGPELGAAHARGEPTHEVHDVPAFTYVGDSTIATLEQHPELGESEVLFLEATHLSGTPHEASERWGHTHIEQLIELYERSPATLASKHIVLKHFSSRYTRAQIREATDLLPAELRARVTLLI